MCVTGRERARRAGVRRRSAACALSFLLMRFNVVNELVTPLAVALNAIPIIVLVPVFNNMFASTTEVPRRLMVTLIVSFIVLVNVAKGLRQVERHPPGADAFVRRVADRDPRQGAHPQRRAVPVHGAQDRRPGRGHHGVRRRVLRRQPERPRLRHHVERRRVAARRRVGVRRRRLHPRARVLPRRRRARTIASPVGSSPHHTPTNNKHGASPPGEQQHEQATHPFGDGRCRRPLTGRCRLRQRRRFRERLDRRPPAPKRQQARDGAGRYRGAGRQRAPATDAGGDCANSSRSASSCSGSPRPSSPATSPPGQGLLRGHVPRRRPSSKAASRSSRRHSSPTATSTSPSRGCPRRSPAVRPGRHRRHRPDLPALRHAAGELRRHGHHLARRLRRQEHRQLGLRQRVRDLRRARGGGPRPGHRRRPSSASSSTWSPCSTARSTPPRR